jgi:hypothetical protein
MIIDGCFVSNFIECHFACIHPYRGRSFPSPKIHIGFEYVIKTYNLFADACREFCQCVPEQNG